MSSINTDREAIIKQLDENLRKLKDWLNSLGIRNTVLLDSLTNPTRLSIVINVDDLGKYIVRESTKNVKINIRVESKVLSFKDSTWLSIVIGMVEPRQGSVIGG